jgi:Ca2+-binding RTX toxin-like protein
MAIDGQNLKGGSGDDVLKGTRDDDKLSGKGGNDALDGRGGSDLLLGGPGNDRIEGGAGDDTLEGGSGNDRLFGNEGDDIFLPGKNSGEGDYILGGRGDDTIDLTAGGRHRIDYRFVPQNMTIEFGTKSGTASKGSWGTDQILGLNKVRVAEGLTLITGSGDDDVSVRARGDRSVRVTDYVGDDHFSGGGDGHVQLQFTGSAGRGVDVTVTGYDSDGRMEGEATDAFGGENTFEHINEIEGTGFADTFTGGDGDDLFYTGLGDDTIDGGAGSDTLIYNAFEIKRIKADLEAGTVGGRGANKFNDSLSGVENIRASSRGDDVINGSDADNIIETFGGDDKIEGRAGNDTLDGGNGNDVIDGGGGKDVVLGGAGDDSVEGGSGHDEVRGGSGNDKVKGGAGNDILAADAGRDVLIGGAGNDVFEFNGGDDKSNKVRDFTDGQDMILISGVAEDFGDVNIVRDGDDVVVSFGAVEFTLLDTQKSDVKADDFLFA